ncbi:MAG: methylmalonyl-CoA epimerase [Chloroflexi bacterium]|nr:methylmalonyl-CoA epimerase [Chloroflexota bacterium]
MNENAIDSSDGPCVARHINHIAIAVKDIDASLALYGKIFGVSSDDIQYIEDQAVRATLVRIGGSQLELIQPTDADGAIARFIERRGEGLHHICFEVDDLPGTLDRLADHEIELVDREPRQGLSGSIAFLHPRSTGGVLIELVDRQGARR